MKKLIITLLCVIVIACGSLIGVFKMQTGAVDTKDHGIKTIKIKAGSGIADIAAILKKGDLIKSEFFFKSLIKLNGRGDKLQAGTYALSKDMNAGKIIDIIATGKVAGKTFSVTSGQTTYKIAATLERAGICSKKEFFNEVEHGKFDYKFMKSLPKGSNRLEGYLYPDTYNISLDGGAHEAIDAMLNQFDKVIYSKYGKDMDDKKLFKTMIMASIIERESQKTEDKAKVADVINNRIKKGMHLQMDSIISYIKNEDKVIASYSDIAVKSAYNPYKNKGLPPGPICSPSIESIEAALNPADTTYLFFVNSDKLDGSLAFSEDDKDFEKDKKAFEKAYKEYIKEHPEKK